MNYYKPRQRQTTLRWDYTNCNDNYVYPIGYCRGWNEKTKEELITKWGEHQAEMFFNAQEEQRPFKDKFHDGGHATAEEACECYKLYVLDHNTRYDLKMHNQQRTCEFPECGVYTSSMAEVNHQTFVLCDAHRNRDSLEKIFTVGESFGSY